MKKLCPYCKKEVDENALFCPHCKLQITEHQKTAYENTVPVPSPTDPVASTKPTVRPRKPKSKWVSLFLCIFTIFGHKLYEGKIGMGFLYLFTVGLFGIGWIVDILVLICKPNPYYV